MTPPPPPRLRLAQLPTPFDPAPRLAEALGLARLWIKREDLSGLALGGNKLRKLELILADAVAAGADTVVTTAGAQSNFCRALAGAAAKCGLGCRLLLRAAGGRAVTGNLLLDHLFGAGISFTDATDPWDPAVKAELDAIAADLRARGRRPYLVQLPGETVALGAAAWAGAAEELATDFARSGDPPALLALACGSGLTLAGLALGFQRLGLPVRLLGVSVQQPAPRLRAWVEEVVGRTAALLGWPAFGVMDAVTITDDQIAPGYGVPSAASLDALTLAARMEGLVLDPVYTGKALAGLRAAVGGGLLPRGGSVVFLHSGGTPGLFAQTEAVAAALR
jgi:1-aminocyclopropane-1-carboxylate deaminase/D-cysteine desulfhydrase-like pyridoxal-dependent ACC family enzyme